ncbi:MAG: beta-ketoacyl-[acyl-carrier-protein] synthase family protein [Patescibacteria group bacterium]
MKTKDYQLRRVAITGVGTLCSMGIGIKEFWKNLIQGKSGIRQIQSFGTNTFKTKIGGEIDQSRIKAFLKREKRDFDRVIGYALFATEAALIDADLKLKRINLNRFGVILGSSKGPFATICEVNKKLFKKEKIDSYHLFDCSHGSISTTIAIRYDLKGLNYLISSTSASASHAIGLAYQKIKWGKADIILTGGAETTLLPEIFALYEATGLLSTNNNPKEACRPFDRLRDGVVLADGSGILILEELEHALKRGAKIYAEVAGYGASEDAYHPASMPENGEGVARAIKLGLEDARVNIDEVDYINPHGASTKIGDASETNAIKSVFGKTAYKIPISGTKSITGHLAGAAGALEAVICTLVIDKGIIPPTINYENPDPVCDLDYVPNKARRRKVKVAISNSMGFGGTNACLIFRKMT